LPSVRSPTSTPASDRRAQGGCRLGATPRAAVGSRPSPCRGAMHRSWAGPARHPWWAPSDRHPAVRQSAAGDCPHPSGTDQRHVRLARLESEHRDARTSSGALPPPRSSGCPATGDVSMRGLHRYRRPLSPAPPRRCAADSRHHNQAGTAVTCSCTSDSRRGTGSNSSGAARRRSTDSRSTRTGSSTGCRDTSRSANRASRNSSCCTSPSRPASTRSRARQN
jgi:hypothetical protein